MPDGQKRVAAALPGNSAQCPDRASGAVYAKLPAAGRRPARSERDGCARLFSCLAPT